MKQKVWGKCSRTAAARIVQGEVHGWRGDLGGDCAVSESDHVCSGTNRATWPLKSKFFQVLQVRGGRLNRNHQHGRFFPQKGNPSRIARGYPPHGQLDGIPLMDS